MEVLSLCPFRAGALAWQSAPNAWSLTVVVKATFSIVVGGEATLAPVQSPVVAFAGDSEPAVEDLSPLKPRVDVLVLRGRNEDAATVEVASCVLPARGPIPPHAPMRRLLLQEKSLEWAALVLRGEASSAGPAPEGFDFSFFHVAPRDQRIDLLRTGVPIVLNHVLPNHPRAETTLPQRKPQAFRIHPQTGKASEIILRCDTLCVDAARGLLVLTFRGIADIDASSQANAGTIVVAAHSAGKKIRADRVERFLRNGESIEGESNDGRHPLEKRYDTVLAAPKGDTMALPEMDGASAGWPALPLAQSDSAIMRAGGGLPFQSAPPEAPSAPAPPAPLHASIGGRRLGTLVNSVDTNRVADMPFQGTLPPPVPDAYMPPVPPEGIFPPPPAFLAITPPSGSPPLIRPPMLGASFAHDEKTADLPPGHEQNADSFDDTTVDLPRQVISPVTPTEKPAVIVAGPPPATTPTSLAGKPAPTAPRPIATLGGPQGPKPLPAAPAAPKPATTAAPKPLAPTAVAPKPVAPKPVAPKPVAPKGPIKAPAPLGPKLKADSLAKPNVVPPVADKAGAAVVKPAAPVKPGPAPLRPIASTILSPDLIKPGMVAATAASAPLVESKESFNAAEALKLEECAALEAELRHRSSARKTLLEKNQLSDESWTAVHKHWANTIARETEVGERKLLVAYDTAYVAVQERLGVKVGIDTYAKLQVAAERGTSATVLGELGLEPADQMRLGRVWTQRLADEPARMRELAAAIENARAS